MFARFYAALLPCLFMAGCASPATYAPFSQASNVQVADVINQLKCEINAFYVTEKFSHVSTDFQLPSDQKADVDLKLQIDVSDQAQGSVKLTPLATLLGASFTPSVGLSASNTVYNEYKFTMRQTIAGQGQLNPNACPSDPKVLGLKEALLAFYRNEPNIQSGAPYVGLESITFSTAFGLTLTGGATGTGAPILEFIPLGPSLSVSASQDGVHTLSIAFKGKAKSSFASKS